MAYIVTLTVRAECSVRVPSLVGPYYEHGNVKEYLKCNHEANRMKLVTVLKLSKLWSLSCNSPTQVTQITSALAYIHGQKLQVVHGDIKSVSIRQHSFVWYPSSHRHAGKHSH